MTKKIHLLTVTGKCLSMISLQLTSVSANNAMAILLNVSFMSINMLSKHGHDMPPFPPFDIYLD